jgi:hypothetical protein
MTYDRRLQEYSGFSSGTLHNTADCISRHRDSESLKYPSKPWNQTGTRRDVAILQYSARDIFDVSRTYHSYYKVRRTDLMRLDPIDDDLGCYFNETS